jgi:hydroxymethylpyrimidine pyrophosphatase-like HAD family hydrolase
MGTRIDKRAGRVQNAIFSSKLDTLDRTAELIKDSDLSVLTQTIQLGAKKIAYAIGSGGSLISAHFFAECRSDVVDQLTIVMTPMEFVLDDRNLAGSQVWLFSGRGENADAHAGAIAARTRGCTDIQIVTSNADASVFSQLPERAYRKHVLATYEKEDGFLSTHSLIAVIAGLLQSTHQYVHGRESEYSPLLDFIKELRLRRDHSRIQEYTQSFSRIGDDDTLIVLADPRLKSASIALETSLWETALCPVQVADFRNFGHGRHVWLHKRGDRTFVLAMTGRQSAPSWLEIEREIPETLRRHHIAYGNTGRLQQAIAIIDAMLIVEAIGSGSAVDPAKPGVGPFARAMYDGAALKGIERDFTRPVRTKLRALRKFGTSDVEWDPVTGFQSFSERLRSAHFHGLVLDYDGTVVSTKARLAPPGRKFNEELERLMDAGLKVGFATGRGGSVGTMLRDHIDRKFHPSILVGYYNGGYMKSLDVDIEKHPPEVANAIRIMTAWVRERNHLLKEPVKTDSTVQISIAIDDSEKSQQFLDELKFAPLVLSKEVRMVFSEHSVDIGLPRNSKLNVVSALGASTSVEPSHILCVGDSGAPHGNDFELLGHAHGVSVRDVCHRQEMCWTVCDAVIDGPDALHAILRALTPISDGFFKLDVRKLILSGTWD